MLTITGEAPMTRYAPLASFGGAAKQGATIGRGEILGLIGAIGPTSVRHLHFEIMIGAFVEGAGAFGLSMRSPFDLPPP